MANGEFGLKIRKYSAAILYELNLGVRGYASYTNAMLNNSMFLFFMKEHGLHIYNNESTRDVICIDFDFGSKSYDGEKKRINKLIKSAKTDEEKKKFESLLDRVEINKDKYRSLSRDRLREEIYKKGIDITYKSYIKNSDKVKSRIDPYIVKEADDIVNSNHITDHDDNRGANNIGDSNLDSGKDIEIKETDETDETDETNQQEVFTDSFGREYVLTTIHYKYLFRTPAKAKLGQAMFINEELYDVTIDWLTMGLNSRMPDKNAKIVEMSAYAPLTTSSVVGLLHMPVNDIVILKDQDSFFRTMVDVVYAQEYDDGNGNTLKRCAVKTQEMDVKNTMWDGMGLVEDKYMPVDSNGMILLRNHFFKMCGFRTNIQLFFKDWCEENNKDYNTHKIQDIFGIEHYLKDIKIITTENAIKWYKKFWDIMGETKQDAYLYWCDKIKRDGEVWGIVKTDHPSKLGQYQQMSYQMINSLPCTKDDIYEIVKTSAEYVMKLKEDVEVFVKYLRKNANISNHFDMLADLYEWNHKFMNSFYFKRERGSIIHAYLEKLRGGRIFVNADNLTLCSNPYALLLYSVGEDWRKDDTIQYEDGCIQCYTKRFEDGEYLAAFRSPHNSPNNIIYLHNIYSDKMERYFNFSKNIMAVNNIKTDIQSRANGCDFDFSINIGIDGSVIQ